MLAYLTYSSTQTNYSSPTYVALLVLYYALQYLFHYAYSHICGSMASFLVLFRAMI